MAVEFRQEPHDLRAASVIEVWVDGEFRCAIYAADEGVRVISRYFEDVQYTPSVPAVFDFKFADVPTELAVALKGRGAGRGGFQ